MTLPEPPKSVAPMSVITPFAAPSSRYGPGHRGIDLAAPPGFPVPALAAGVVSFVGQVAGKPVVTVRLATGMRTTYEPVIAQVAVGQRVATGQVLGITAAGPDGGHCAMSGCVHVGLRLGQQYFDPAALLGDRVVLKPQGRR